MGGGQSIPIPGGGTEGYHVLRVCSVNLFNGQFIASQKSRKTDHKYILKYIWFQRLNTLKQLITGTTILM